jgi:hypothetical protein
MKKIGIIFQAFSCLSALLAVIKKISLVIISPNRNTASLVTVLYSYSSNKSGIPSIQLPK